MRDPLFLKIAEYIRRHHMIRPGDCVLAAVSGGADSVFLLHVLKMLSLELACSVKVVHVEHGIRGGNSLRDAEFVEQLCRTEGISCRVEHVDAPAFAKQAGIGIEEAARLLRYQVLERIAGDERANRIAVAHHMEDNAETMLFHLARGTGLAGLAGIPPVRGRIIRPLLCVSREEIEAWLIGHEQSWCLDETNTDTSLSRNLIRAEVLPRLKEINPETVSHMAQTAELLRKTNAFLDQEIEKIAKNAESRDGLDVSVLRELDPVIREHFVYHVLQQEAGTAKDLSREHVNCVCALIEKPVGKQISLPYNLVAERTYDAIRIRKEYDNKASQQKDMLRKTGEAQKDIILAVPGKTIIDPGHTIEAEIISYHGEEEKIPRNPYTKWFDYDRIKNGLHIRGRKPGDYLQIDRKGGHKSMQDYMVNEKIPAGKRDQVRLLADGSHIVWVIGRRISEAYKVTRETKRVLVLRITCAGSKGETI